MHVSAVHILGCRGLIDATDAHDRELVVQKVVKESEGAVQTPV